MFKKHLKVKKKTKSPVISPINLKRETYLPQMIFDEAQDVNLLDGTFSETHIKKEMSIDLKQ